VPDGGGEEDNRVESEWGTPRSFDFTPREHADIAPALGMDFETGARLSGARFTFLRGGMARLHRALGQFMLDVQTGEHGYAECNPPVLVGDKAMYGTDKLPKFGDDSFQTNLTYDDERMKRDYLERAQTDPSVTDPEAIADAAVQFHRYVRQREDTDRRWLIPTSEVSLTASVMGELLDESALPMRLTALTLCFRSEAGAAGRDTRGFIRQHQFEKCELVSIVRPEDSEAEHQRMVRAAETILERLNLPYRKLLLCTGDMGFGARKTYDLEVWLPGQGAFREISSCSNTGDFQARRMNTRYRVAGEKRTEFVHTLNGSGLAVGRTLVAVIENYQNADGSVTVPEALRSYMGGLDVIAPR
jgi:seryl-tRNA synthetase